MARSRTRAGPAPAGSSRPRSRSGSRRTSSKGRGPTMSRRIALVALLVAGASVPAVEPSKKPADPFVFRDVGTETGLLPAAAGIRGHGVAWGDADGDGWPDLFIATFHNQGSKPGVFLCNEKGKFRADDQEHLRTTGIGSGA